MRSSVKSINSLENKLSVDQPDSFEYFYFAFERFSIKNLKDLQIRKMSIFQMGMKTKDS